MQAQAYFEGFNLFLVLVVYFRLAGLAFQAAEAALRAGVDQITVAETTGFTDDCAGLRLFDGADVIGSALIALGKLAEDATAADPMLRTAWMSGSTSSQPM